MKRMLGLVVSFFPLFSKLILQIIFACSSFCEIARLLFGDRTGRWLAKTIYRLIFNGLVMPLGRVGTRYEYLCLAQIDLTSQRIQSLLKPSQDIVQLMKFSPRTAPFSEAPFDCYASEIPKPFLEKMTFLDVRQGVGYDLTQDERAVLSPLFVYGHRERSPFQVKVTSRLLTWLANYSPTAELRVLDIGAGNCSSTERLAAILPVRCSFVSCDINPNIMRLGLRRLARKPEINAYLMLCDGMNLPFEDNSFDLVVNFGSINQMPNPAQAMSEMLRVCTPGGLTLCRDERGVDPDRVGVLEREWLRRFDNERLPFAALPPEAKDVQLEFLDSINFCLSFEKTKQPSDLHVRLAKHA